MLVQSPWSETFERFVRSIDSRATIVAPFITAQPLQSFASMLDSDNEPQINLLTNLSADSLLQGSVDGKAIAEFCRAIPNVSVRHLPGLHAKVYVADEHTAIITSGNLTHGSLHQNYEYGIQINEPATVRRVARDLQEYGNLGASVSVDELDHIAAIAVTLKDKHSRQLKSAQSDLRREFERQLESVRESLMQLRGKPGETANAIFARTILYLLRNGPLPTREMHPLIQNIHPDLCDDRVDRIINGLQFGKAWKHRVRGAQANLKRQGLIDLVEGHWQLIQ
ncbi:MAG: phospholipase D-like domain-containing protein [Dehalococcoidia bacterium]|nr:phospholipase D-like domain-containing protein [Dehalococcoidia bacterium]